MFQVRVTEGNGSEGGCLHIDGVETEAGRRLSADRCGQVIRELYLRHHRALVGYLRSKLSSLEEAEEVAQDAYLRMLALEDAPCIEQLQAYLFRIAANLSTDRMRRQLVRERHELIELPELASGVVATMHGPECMAMSGETLQLVSGAIDSMPARRRRAFLDAVFHGRSTAQVAAEMGVSIKMVEKHLASARAHCRKVLAAAGVELDVFCARRRPRAGTSECVDPVA